MEEKMLLRQGDSKGLENIRKKIKISLWTKIAYIRKRSTSWDSTPPIRWSVSCQHQQWPWPQPLDCKLVTKAPSSPVPDGGSDGGPGIS